MSVRKSTVPQILFTRRDGTVKGPFPRGMVRRFVLLGRLRLVDEVSPDRQHWRTIEQYPELIPKEMQQLETDEDYERLMAARLREDERGRDRRQDSQHPFPGRRRGDRRETESAMMRAHREVRNGLYTEYQRQPRLIGPSTVLGLFLAAFVVAAVYLFVSMPPPVHDEGRCLMPAGAGVDWSHCKLEGLRADNADLEDAVLDNADLRGADLHGANLAGSDLAYANLSTADLRYADLSKARLFGAGLRNADLSHAQLVEADLSYANLLGAKMGGAVLRGVKLDKAIWIDGRRCAPGSTDTCLALPAAQ